MISQPSNGANAHTQTMSAHVCQCTVTAECGSRHGTAAPEDWGDWYRCRSLGLQDASAALNLLSKGRDIMQRSITDL
jgi:hypothetical protein